MIENFDYQSDIPIGYYDNIYRKRKGVQSKWHELKFVRVASEIKDHDKILDYACGPGTFLGNYGSKWNGTGVDISRPQIEYANNQYRCHFTKFCLLEDIDDFENHQPYDTVTLIELIEHLPIHETKELLTKLGKELKSGGQLIVTTPNYHSTWPIIECLVNRFSPVSYENQHINKYCAKRLKQELEECGYINVTISRIQFSAPFWAVISWKLADAIYKFEQNFERIIPGNLLLARAIKP